MNDIIFSLTFKIFVIVITGFAGAKAGIIDESMKKSLTSLLMNIVLPFSILASSQQTFARSRLTGLGQSLLIAVIYYLVTLTAMIALSKLLHVKETTRRILVLLIAFANVGFVGFSVMGQLLGDTGTLFTVAHNSAYQLFFFSFGLYYLKQEGKLTFKSLFGNRIIWISLTAMLLYLMPFRVPQVLTDSMSTVGSMMMPVSMLIIGAEIAGMNLKQVFCNPLAFLASGIRMLLLPALMLLITRILGVSSDVAITAVVLTALPSGSLNVIMAREYDCDPEFAAVVVSQNMIFMIITLPLFCYLAVM